MNTCEYIYDRCLPTEPLPKSVTRTLRLDEDVDEALEKMAKEGGESVNTVVGRALRKLVEWDRLADRAGLVMISPVTLERLMEPQTVEQARELGKAIAIDAWKPMILTYYGEITITSVLESIELIARYMSRFDFHYASEGSKRVITIRHSMGVKWSAFYIGAASVLLSGLGIDFKVSMTEELASLEFEMPRKGEKGPEAQ
jgi:hypothetical protein